MSSQAGIWNFDGKPIDQTLLARFGCAMDCDGPDGGAAYTDVSIGMLYRAFHTTAESRREQQPHKSAGGIMLTWDGRLDNRDELAAQLSDRVFADCSDLVIVAAAFDRWGADCFRRLMGDWALTIWRPRDRTLILAVDFLSVRHIFYYLRDDRLWWSTSLTPLVLLSGDKFHLDDEYISGYFANNADAHRTPYREIRQVPPGQFVLIRNATSTVERHWRFNPRSRIRYNTDAEYEEHFRQVFRQSVRRRLRADTPVLGELSGGLDSSSVICMADDILAKEGAQTPRLDTLSFYDRTEPDGDDWIYFRKIEERRGRAGAHVDTSTLGTSPAPLGYSSFSALPGQLGVARKIQAERAAIVRRGNYRAVLSGIGGDEFLGGVPDPTAHLADLIVQCRLPSLARQLIAWSLVKRRPWIQLLWQASMDLLPAYLGQYLLKQAAIEPWINADFAKRTGMASRQLGRRDGLGLRLPTRRSYIQTVVHMSNKLAKHVPRALEEIRYPYLDQTLIEFVLSIPADQLLRPGERRSLMRRALVGLVPQEVLSRRTKQFAARTPVFAVEKNWEELGSYFRSPFSSRLGYIDARRFLERLGQARSGQEIHIVRMLRTISLELWLRHLAAQGLLADSPCGQAYLAA